MNKAFLKRDVFVSPQCYYLSSALTHFVTMYYGFLEYSVGYNIMPSL